jgi:hypothetical protein
LGRRDGMVGSGSTAREDAGSEGGSPVRGIQAATAYGSAATAIRQEENIGDATRGDTAIHEPAAADVPAGKPGVAPVVGSAAERGAARDHAAAARAPESLGEAAIRHAVVRDG